jgi:hypothetical protein
VELASEVAEVAEVEVVVEGVRAMMKEKNLTGDY